MMRIIHFSDTHEPAVLKFSSFFDKRLIGCANSLVIRRRRYDPSRTDRMIGCILREKPDCVVFTGDPVSTSEPEEFERAAVRFEPLAGSGIPADVSVSKTVFALIIPGILFQVFMYFALIYGIINSVWLMSML